MCAKRRCQSEHAARLYKNPRRETESRDDDGIDDDENPFPAERMLANLHVLNSPPELCDVGPMSADEAELIRRSLSSFQHEYNLDVEGLVTLLQSSPYNKDGTESYRDETQRIQVKNLWSLVYSDFEGRRPQRSVRDWVRRHYTTGRRLTGWTGEEDQRLIDAHHETPGQWLQIAAAVGDRTSDDCWCRWRDYLQHREQKTKSRWSEEEETRLRRAVAQVQEEHGSLYWPRVSELFNHTRSRIQCLQKYQQLLARDENPDAPRRRRPKNRPVARPSTSRPATRQAIRPEKATATSSKASSASQPSKAPSAKNQLNASAPTLNAPSASQPVASSEAPPAKNQTNASASTSNAPSASQPVARSKKHAATRAPPASQPAARTENSMTEVPSASEPVPRRSSSHASQSTQIQIKQSLSQYSHTDTKPSLSQLPYSPSASENATPEPSGRVKLSPTPSVIEELESTVDDQSGPEVEESVAATLEETPFSPTPPPSFPEDPLYYRAAIAMLLSVYIAVLDGDSRVDFDKTVSDVDWDFLRWLLPDNISSQIKELPEDPKAIWDNVVQAIGGEQEWFADTVIGALNYVVYKAHGIENCYVFPSMHPDMDWSTHEDIIRLRPKYDEKAEIWLARPIPYQGHQL